MNVGILGLGLIGGSLARAYAKAGHTVFAVENDQSIFDFAIMAGAVHEPLSEETIPCCDLILLAIYSGGSAAWLEKNGRLVSKHTLVIDCCGIKEQVCNRCFPVAEKYGFTFVGGHPMAGSHFSGFKYSRSNLFQGAPMVLVPPVYDDPTLLSRVKEALAPCNFGSFSVTTAQDHDKMIAFLSQLTHCLAVALMTCNDVTDLEKYTGDSFRDLTRIAKINDTMWSELFSLNKEYLVEQMETFSKQFDKLKQFIIEDNQTEMREMMKKATQRRMLFDKPVK